ncbi:hypothetical protein [Streptomyces qinzhouensis]|uniref:Uncharacterized protein n=1 Tax=Streptomyces qinzhouensis TaxID=2599401 RepID=A0A5B8JH46_9ACTN|nr:hypothetical protein [Streptomyces qinzhouensis]QDY79644.1 hypothetical protein FQU76_27415 [Streptomyces qinzhouensis]
MSRAPSTTWGEWVYLLENGFAATWFFGYRSVPEMAPFVGEEIICLTLNRHDAPALILHAPGDGRTWQTEFGDSTDRSPDLDDALRAAGAVFPSLTDGVSTEDDRTTVEEGLLPLALLPMPVV